MALRPDRSACCGPPSAGAGFQLATVAVRTPPAPGVRPCRRGKIKPWPIAWRRRTKAPDTPCMPTSTPPGACTTCSDVLSVLALADGAGARLWIDGGWGVDALLGGQTREHGDLDV